MFTQHLILYTSSSLLGTLIETIRTFAVILVIIGMLIAFMRKIAWLIEFMAGFALTCLATYIIWNWSQNIALTILMFFFFLGGTLVSATVAEITVIIEGFIAAWIGVGVILITEGWGINMNTAIVSALISAVLIWISATLGGNITKLFPEITRKKTKKQHIIQRETMDTSRQSEPVFRVDEKQTRPPASIDFIEKAKKELEENRVRMEIGEITMEEFEASKKSIKQRLLNKRDELFDQLSKGQLQEEDVEYQLNLIDKLLISMSKRRGSKIAQEPPRRKRAKFAEKSAEGVVPILLIKCPHCNAKIPKGSLYCPECGGKQPINKQLKKP